jgi:hypothetical protein
MNVKKESRKKHIPAPVVSISDSTQQTLISVDTSKQQSLLAALAQPLVHRQVRVPHTTHTGLVEANILGRHDLLERLVNVSIPGAAEQASLSVAVVVLNVGAEADVPAVALVLSQVAVEAAGDGGRHDLEIVVGDAPVQPAALDTKLLALFNDLEQGLDGSDAAGVVVVHGVDEEVLHVDNDQDGGGGVNGNASVVDDTMLAGLVREGWRDGGL